MKNHHDKKIGIHPGEVLDEILQELAVTQVALAKNINVARPYISDIINGRRNMSAVMAFKLQAAVGIPAETWMNLQKNWELSRVKPQIAKGIKSMAA